MTVTTTTPTAGAEALYAPGYPASAAVESERYWWHLARLRESATRERAAEHAQALARAAGRIAVTLTGDPGAAPDTATDPVAWTDLATYLTRLALALHGGLMCPGGRFDIELDDIGWDELAGAATRREFAAAWYLIREILQELAAPGCDDDAALLRSFTVAQVTRAAAAIIDAPW